MNTATVCVNDKIRLEDSAKVKPVDDWFVLRKIADFRHEGQDVPCMVLCSICTNISSMMTYRGSVAVPSCQQESKPDTKLMTMAMGDRR